MGQTPSARASCPPADDLISNQLQHALWVSQSGPDCSPGQDFQFHEASGGPLWGHDLNAIETVCLAEGFGKISGNVGGHNGRGQVGP